MANEALLINAGVAALFSDEAGKHFQNLLSKYGIGDDSGGARRK
jgi:hypothetical protein